MYLKRLEMQGFKSFVEKTVLDFAGGITAVVGPNGSGKSNIADAIRWVLGEQSIKTLRGSKMEDVIFSGTEHRKPLGFAEVSITMDNTDMAIPLEYSEVTITRRVYRSGESEYLINKAPCRLKDITGLFLDTGVGRDGYSVIGQGRIDEILSSRAEDRRSIFEEASGIMKYKVRKQEAEKKLELTRQNLERINDIIIELESQLGPLKEQSETARRYLNLRENLKELEINVYLDSMDNYRRKLGELDEQCKNLKSNIESETARLEAITASSAEKSALLKSADEKMEASRRQYYEIEGDLERCRSEIRLNEEKISISRQHALRLDSEQKELKEKLESLDKEAAGREEKIRYLEQQLEDYGTKLNEYETRMEGLLKTLDEGEKHIEMLKSDIMEKMDIQSDKKMQIGNIRTHLENIRKRQKNIDNEIYQYVLENDREKSRKEDLAENLRQLANQTGNLRHKLEKLSAERDKTDVRLKGLRTDQSRIKSEIQFKASRLKTLQEMEKNLEGYNRSVREILRSCRESSNLGAGIHGALAQLIKVEGRYETAIEIVLGSALQNIVTGSEKDAQKAIEYLKEKKLGRATFLPASSVKGKGFGPDMLGRLSKCDGFLGIASELVAFDSRYEGIIKSLLGKTAFVDNLDNAIKMARMFGYSFRIVTPDGDLVSAGGSMSGGSFENKGTSILSRAREIMELEKAVSSLKLAENQIETEISAAMADIERLNNEISGLESGLKNCELEKIKNESELSRTEENIKKASARIDMLQREKEQLDKQTAENIGEMEKYNKELENIELEIEEARKRISERQEKYKESRTMLDGLHTAITDYKISVNSIKESMAAARENSERIASEKEAVARSVAKKESEKAMLLDQIGKLEESIGGLKEMIKKQEEARSGRTFEMDRLAEERKMLEEELYDIIGRINDANKNIGLLKEEYSRLEVKKAKIETEMNSLQDMIWNEYELTYSSALKMKKDIGSVAQAQKKIAGLRNEIRELGPVNVASIEDYIKTKERHDFMTEQKNDMEQAREKLLRVIHEMTAIMKKQFMEQLKLINENFNLVFRELFNGGRAGLILIDQENVLESGIEIEAQPPGKKLQNMMLLSGGERALTAIALLFAILKLRPTPFCVLDEIEAALDEANVYRFIRYLRHYSAQTQFIVVTHRKSTMEGSDVLYGVTMQELGVSKIISMKMGEKVG